ncbi:TetR/AcrR family transcriptional regulator [Lactococcus protaetiae]|uniref:TetR/AcrR family transcriptional regulator n=1 Tax=Lactococcus protaetiae TaxID=2592653 RepID=A0A514Z6K3_9LACT|nr:TetR/AcrR family transcriptional regulator [Lactococcus protaetiae]MCL2114026.1 TetR/AcrR family transcriptional regulator [Streptococcaceae bacterium]QDK70222.1 TetR/AcrR family transcriptional regulator [Lactococcus protaetiae]
MTESAITTLYEQTLDKLEHLTERQKLVLRAALKLFASQGFEATSTAQIAAEAGVASGSVYKQFKNKQELLVAVLAPLFQGTLDAMADEFADSAFNVEYETLEDFINALVVDRMTYIHDNFQEIRLLFGQLLTNSTFTTQVKSFFGEQLQKLVVPTINRLQKENKMVNLPHDIIFEMAFGMVVAYFGKILIGLDCRTLEEETKYVSQLLIKALRV